MEMAEGEGSTGDNYVDVETTATSLSGSIVFHIINDAVGFVLYMHQQIPSVLQDMSLEFDGLQEEYKDLDGTLTQPDVKPLARRTIMSRRREVKHGIRKLEKLMSTISSVRNAMKLMICDTPGIQRFMLILGGNPLRPQRVYEFFLPHRENIPDYENDFTKSKAADALSRKTIRTMITKGAGSSSCPGPMKLFIFALAPPSLNLPEHFLPKRDFRYNRKIVPLRLRIKCRTQESATHTSLNSASNDLIWFQCRHVIKGLSFQTPEEE